MINLPSGIKIDNLVDDLKAIGWEASNILLHYSKKIKSSKFKNEIVKYKKNQDPVTLADLEVNEKIIKRIYEKYSFSEWNLISEENTKLDSLTGNSDSDWLWILDPLDGTKDFIQGTGNYAIHLALNYKNKPYLGVVIIPEKDELWISDGQSVWCEGSGSMRSHFSISKNKSLNEMTLVTSKNHNNSALQNLIKKISFKKVTIMGSIGCKIASLVRGESDIYICLSIPGKTAPKDWDFAAPEAILRGAGGAITYLDNKDLIYNQPNNEQGGIIIASNNKQKHESICLQVKEIIKKFDLYPLDFN